jgi:small subunit ribosomal protein S16
VAVKLRLKRTGRKHLPCYRLNAIDSRAPRDGRAIEELGVYDPLQKDPDKQINFKRERIEYWLSVGAVPSETVANLLETAGILVGR